MSAKPVFVKVCIENAQVVLLFSEKPEFLKPCRIDRWNLDPKECLDIVQAMADAAFECRDGVKPVGPALKTELADRHRMTLTQKYVTVLNTFREDKVKTNGQLAQTLADIAIQDIFS